MAGGKKKVAEKVARKREKKETILVPVNKDWEAVTEFAKSKLEGVEITEAQKVRRFGKNYIRIENK